MLARRMRGANVFAEKESMQHLKSVSLALVARTFFLSFLDFFFFVAPQPQSASFRPLKKADVPNRGARWPSTRCCARWTPPLPVVPLETGSESALGERNKRQDTKMKTRAVERKDK